MAGRASTPISGMSLDEAYKSFLLSFIEIREDMNRLVGLGYRGVAALSNVEAGNMFHAFRTQYHNLDVLEDHIDALESQRAT